MGLIPRWNVLLPILGGIMVARALVGGTAISRRALYPPTARSEAEDITCGFAGNSDAYGFGIRLGIYLQWTAVILSCRFTTSSTDKKELMDTHTLFSTAILIAIIALTVQDSGLHSIEIIILLYIWYTDAFNNAATLTKAREIENSLVGLGYSLIIFIFMSSYALWFWYRGVNESAPSPCGTYVFLFAKADVYGRGGAFFRALITIYMVLTIFSVGVKIVAPFAVTLYYACKAVYNTARQQRRQRKGIEDYHLDLNNGSTHIRGRLNIVLGSFLQPHRKLLVQLQVQDTDDAKFSSLFNAYGPIVSLIWSVIGIELMVHWNHISGVYVLGQTGQLIPLVIGIGSMIKTFYSINNERWLLSVWHPEFEAFRKPGGPWMRFKKTKPKRRNST